MPLPCPRFCHALTPLVAGQFIRDQGRTQGVNITGQLDGGLRFNTPISRMTEFVNAATNAKQLPRSAVETFLVVLSPYAPHLAEELWRRLGHAETIADATWPVFDPAALETKTVTVVIQIKGKRRGQIEISPDAGRDAILEAARSVPNVARHLDGFEIIKEIVVPGRLVNFVVRPRR